MPHGARCWVLALSLFFCLRAAAQPPTLSSPSGFLVARGDAALARGDSISAVAYYRDAIQRAPRHPGAYVALGRAYLRLEEPEHAREVFAAGLRNTRGADELALGLADAYEALGDHARALETLRALAAEGGAAAPLFQRLAQLAEASGNLSEALAARRALVDALQNDPATRPDALRDAQLRVAALTMLLGPVDRLSALHCGERESSAVLRALSGCP